MRRRQSKAAPVSGLIVYTYAKLCVLIIISDIISMIELRHLRCFLGIARERTITRAAEALHISQPALSRTLQELEEDLGQQLIVRGKPLTLTAKGELLRQRAESMLDYFENFKQEISSEADELTGTITIAAGESPSVELLAAAFFKLKERWPRIRFALKSGNEFDVTTALNSGLADFGILIASPKAAEYYHLILPQRDPWVLWVPEEHALAQKERIEPQDFADLPVVIHAFNGVRACVCALILSSILKLRKSSVVDGPTTAIFAAVLVLAVVGNFVTVPEGAAGAVLGFITSPIVLVVAAGVAGLCVRAAKGGLRK